MLLYYNISYVLDQVQNKMCRQCKAVKAITEFQLYTKQDAVNTCKSCVYLKVTINFCQYKIRQYCFDFCNTIKRLEVFLRKLI